MGTQEPKNVKKLVADHTKAKKPGRADRIRAAKEMQSRKPKKGKPSAVLALIEAALRRKGK